MAGMPTQQLDAQDRSLAQRAQAGDKAAFEVLFERHSHPAWRAALAVAGTPEAAERAVIDAFTAVFRRLRGDAATAGQSFRSLVVRASMDAAAAEAVDLTPPPAPNPTAAAFLTLPVRWRGALWLADVEGGTDRQVGTLLGLPTESAAAVLGRARRGLGHQLGIIGGAPLGEEQRRDLRALVPPVPAGLAASAVTWWLAWHESTAEHKRGLAAVLPLGPWAERALAGVAAAVLTAGIASAVALGARDATRRPDISSAAGGEVAAGSTGTATTSSDPTGGTAPGQAGASTAHRTATRGGSAGTDASDAFGGSGGGTPTGTAAPAAPGTGGSHVGVPGTPSPGPVPDTATSPSLNVGLDLGGTPVGVELGSNPGVQVGGTTIGSTPPAPGGTVDVQIDLGGGAPPITLQLP